MNSRISQILINALKNENLVLNLPNIVQYLENDDEIRHRIYTEVEKECHKEDIYNELRFYNEENDTNITFTDDEIDLILEQYEHGLCNSEDWHYILNDVLNDWIEEKLND